MSRPARLAWGLLVAASLLAGSALGGFFSLPYATAKRLANAIARDGDLESLTQPLFARLGPFLLAAGAVLLVAGIGMLVFRKQSQSAVQALLRRLIDLAVRFRADLGLFGAALLRSLPGRRTALLVGCITFLGLLMRLALLSRPMTHDEAYTFEAFAAEPVRYIVSNYHLPNNHVFHSLLVHWTTWLAGIQPWAVRLPAFISGVLLVPAGYLLARRAYGPRVAFLSAALIAACPLLIDYSTNARGYSLETLITLLAFSLAIYLKTHKNLAGWGALIGLSALGFYTIPVMLYPFGLLMAWLFLSALTGETRPAYGSLLAFIKYLVAAGIATALLTLLFYSPIIRSSGLAALASNDTVQPLPWQAFVETVPGRLWETWNSWNTRLPDLSGLVIAALILSLAFHSKTSSQRVPVQLAALIALPAILVVQRGNPWPKIWTFLLPLALIWTAAGLMAPLELLRTRWPGLRRLAAGVTAAGVLAVLAGGIFQMAVDGPALSAMGQAESTVLQLKDRLQGDDVVAVEDPDNAPFWYYFRVHGIPSRYIRAIKSRPFSRGFIVVNTAAGETPHSVIDACGPDYVFFNMDTAKAAIQDGVYVVYEIYPFEDAVRKAYGLP